MFTRIQQTSPITYELVQPGDGAYNSFLVTPPRLYRERIRPSNGLQGFYYNRARDRYILITWMDFAAWPSWRINAYEIHPETGQVTRQWFSLSGAVGFAWTRNCEAGELGKVYANRIAGPPNSIVEVSTDPFTIGQTIVSSADVQGFVINHFVISRTAGIVALSDTSQIRTYHYPSQTRLGTLAMPELQLSDLAYESEERAWALMNNPAHGLSAVKLNYQRLEIETFTKLESNAQELGFSIAYDNLRNSLAVFRQMPDAVDGAAQHLLDIYKPISRPIGMTGPVPVQSAHPGKVIKMIGNVVFERGGMGRSVPVTLFNSGAGTLLSRRVACRANGELAFQYRYADNQDTDIIQADVLIP